MNWVAIVISNNRRYKILLKRFVNIFTRHTKFRVSLFLLLFFFFIHLKQTEIQANKLYIWKEWKRRRYMCHTKFLCKMRELLHKYIWNTMNDVLRCIHTINIEGNENNTLYVHTEVYSTHNGLCDSLLCQWNEWWKKTLSI